MKLSGRLSIGYPRGGGSDREVVSIEIKDASSGCIFAEVRVEYVEWARALSCLAYRPCEIQFYEKAPLGKVHEHKTEVVKIPLKVDEMHGESRRAGRRARVKQLLKPFEVDGWKGCVEDTENHHRWVKSDDKSERAYRVTFHRYVDPPAEGQQPKGEE